MEDLPIDILGSIFSRVEAARDLVVVSTACKKWQEAWRNHLDTLAFYSNDWSGYDNLTISEIEVIITQTIVQTKALQCLYITFEGNFKFSKVSVITWLKCTKESLRQLHYNVATEDLNILEECGRRRLEVLYLAVNTITSFDPRYLKFPCLRFVSLYRVKISTLNLSFWLSTCPKVEVLDLVNMDFGTDSPQMSMKLRSNSLKEIHIEACVLKKISLKGNSLEKLRLIDCNIPTFKLKGQEKLRILVLNDVISSTLKVYNNAEDIEIVAVYNFTTSRFYFYDIIAKLSNVRRMDLCGVMFEDDNNENVKGKNGSASFPQLTHLTLTYKLGHAIQHGLLGHGRLENVVKVELRWRSIFELESYLAEELMRRCPNLRTLLIVGAPSGVHTPVECNVYTDFTGSIVRLMREYIHVNVLFHYV